MLESWVSPRHQNGVIQYALLHTFILIKGYYSPPLFFHLHAFQGTQWQVIAIVKKNLVKRGYICGQSTDMN